MNTSTSWALTLALVLAGSSARAQGAALPLQDYPTGQRARSSEKHENGVVMAVDAKAGKLKIKDEQGKVRRFSAEKAKVLAAEGRIISLADLAVGDQVSVTYDVSLKGRDATEVLRTRKIRKQ